MAFGDKLADARKNAEAVRKFRTEQRTVRHTDPSGKVKAARTRLESDIGKWMRHHGGEAFSSAWSDDHRKVLAKIETAINKGGLFALAMPRGGGKSTILKWVTVYVLLTGCRKYVCVIAATAELAQSIVEFVRQQITESDTLHEHYPHATTYARATEGKAIKARFQLRADGKTSGIQWSKNTLVLPEVLDQDGNPYKSNGGILEGHGLTGAIRGKWRDTKTGKVLRPDFVILDDPQTRESAESVSQCDMRERIITGDILGLAGPRKRIAAVMPCTIIRRGDLAARFLDHAVHPEWRGETCRLVNEWPKEQDGLWVRYAEIYRGDAADGGGHAAATEFYAAHQAAMDEGAVVSWPARIRDGELSAIQTAENMLIEMGPQFWAEMQNEPKEVSASLYELTADMVLAHSVATPRLHLPDAAGVFVGFIDINRAGLHWCLAGYDQQMTGHCPAYGRWPDRGELWAKNANELVRKQAIFGGLKALCEHIAAATFVRGGARVQPSTILIDRGFEPDVVHRFCAQASYPFRVVPSRGYAANKYWPRKATMVGRAMEGCHVTRGDTGQFLAFNADSWRETSQRAWLTDAGAPGGFTLFAGGREHMPFAEHVVAEKLVNKYETELGLRWEWSHVPGSYWDWGDAVTGCWVAAAAAGLSASGMQGVERVKPKARVVIRRPSTR